MSKLASYVIIIVIIMIVAGFFPELSDIVSSMVMLFGFSVFKVSKALQYNITFFRRL